jgi:hypothetical protein
MKLPFLASGISRGATPHSGPSPAVAPAQAGRYKLNELEKDHATGDKGSTVISLATDICDTNDGNGSYWSYCPSTPPTYMCCPIPKDQNGDPYSKPCSYDLQHNICTCQV